VAGGPWSARWHSGGRRDEFRDDSAVQQVPIPEALRFRRTDQATLNSRNCEKVRIYLDLL